MIVFPNAKINLGLRIVEKRGDGYHNIETVFLPIGLNDVLEFVESAGNKISIHISGVQLEGRPEENLVVKAWELMREQCGIPIVDIHLHKIIPVGAGLGGGSSDAAFMLKGLNDFFECGCTIGQLEEMALNLGSDCAFFIRNKPAIGTGRGEILDPVEPELSGYELVLINPGLHISTRDAYGGITPQKSDRPLRELLLFPLTQWQEYLVNEFEDSVFQKFKKIGEIKLELIEAGAVYASMSGSGSSVFGIFREGSIPENIKDRFSGFYTWTGGLA
jgi:4-diphosphocytidyl-2-C-methyl-D-erythritol kinase